MVDTDGKMTSTTKNYSKTQMQIEDDPMFVIFNVRDIEHRTNNGKERVGKHLIAYDIGTRSVIFILYVSRFANIYFYESAK